MPTASRASEWSLLPASFQTAWPALQREFPGVAAKFRWGRVHAIYGRPFGGGRTPLQSAENFLSEFGGGLFGLGSGTELVLDRIVAPAPGEGPVYVHFHQEYAGRPLDGAHLSLTIANREGYPITLASGFIHPTPAAYLRARQRTREQAIQIARDLFGERNVSIDRITEVIWPVGNAPEYGWTMDVVPADAPDDGERITVGTFDGRVLRRRPLVQRFGDWTATVKGEKSKIEDEPPDCDNSIDPTEEINLAEVTVTLTWVGGSTSGLTDSNGQVTLDPAESEFDVEAKLENDWFKFLDRSLEDDPLRIETGNQTNTTYKFINNIDDWPNTVQMINAWKWLHFSREWVGDLDSSYSLGSKITVRCNGSSCSPGYNRTNLWINYSNRNTDVGDCSGGHPCICVACMGDPTEFAKDFHYNTIIVHEYGHHLTFEEYPGVNLISPTYSETMADIISGFITGESKMGAKLCECADWPDITVDINNTWVWPRFVDQRRKSGLPFSGAYWDMRVDLADNDLAGKILLHGIKKNPIGVDPTVALHALLVDDDSGVNGDPDADDTLSNGSPNYETINAAFRAHGLANQNAVYVAIDWSGSAPGDVADDVDLDVAVTVDPGNLTLVDCSVGPPCPVVLRWRKNSGISGPGAWIPVDMEFRALQGDYQVSISSSNYAVGDVLDFYVRVEVTDSDKQYTCFPRQGQFDWSVPNSDNIPEERDFFSVLVTDQTKVIALSKDLQTDPGWTVGTDEWEWGAPNLEDFGQQPGNDYPFDNDVHQAGFAPNCYFTSNTDDVGRNETWTLTTEDFDLSELDGVNDKVVISYALWFYVRQGQTADKFTVEIWDGTNWSDPIDTVAAMGVDGSATALQRWIRRRITLDDVNLHGTGKKLRFSAISGEFSGGTIEAVVDEVRVWGVKDD